MRPGGRRTAVSSRRPPHRGLGFLPLSLILLLAVSCGGSWVRVQNLGNAPANVTVTYYDENGGRRRDGHAAVPTGRRG